MRSELQTDQPLPVISSQRKGIVINPDTSGDIWFSPAAPADHESNWLQTVPGKGWNTIFRINGALESWFDKTWKPGEIEPVKQGTPSGHSFRSRQRVGTARARLST